MSPSVGSITFTPIAPGSVRVDITIPAQPIPAPPPDEDVEDIDNDDAGDEPVEEGDEHA